MHPIDLTGSVSAQIISLLKALTTADTFRFCGICYCRTLYIFLTASIPARAVTFVLLTIRTSLKYRYAFILSPILT